MVEKYHISCLKKDLFRLKTFQNLLKIFIKSYNKKSNERYIFEVGTQYSGNLHELYNDLHFLNEIGKVDEVKKNYYTNGESNISIKSWISFEKNS